MMKRKRSSGGKVLVSSSTKTKTPKERSMNETKYMGMDVHKAMTVIAVLNGVGKTVAEAIIETKARTILDFIKSQRGTLHVAFEEGTQAAWLYDLIKPYVADVVVCNPRRIAKQGTKGDKTRCQAIGGAAAHAWPAPGLPRRAEQQGPQGSRPERTGWDT